MGQRERADLPVCINETSMVTGAYDISDRIIGLCGIWTFNGWAWRTTEVRRSLWSLYWSNQKTGSFTGKVFHPDPDRNGRRRTAENMLEGTIGSGIRAVLGEECKFPASTNVGPLFGKRIVAIRQSRSLSWGQMWSQQNMGWFYVLQPVQSFYDSVLQDAIWTVSIQQNESYLARYSLKCIEIMLWLETCLKEREPGAALSHHRAQQAPPSNRTAVELEGRQQ